LIFSRETNSASCKNRNLQPSEHYYDRDDKIME